MKKHDEKDFTEELIQIANTEEEIFSKKIDKKHKFYNYFGGEDFKQSKARAIQAILLADCYKNQ